MNYILLFILSSLYYFQIKGSPNSDQIVRFAKSKIGCGYVWSGEGQILTEDEINYLHNQYPDEVDPNVVSRWLGKQVYDCSGLVMKAFETIEISLYHNAHYAWSETNWAEKGPIANYPRDKVCILYRYNSEKERMVHTGIYIGGNRFIHAKSSADGVVMESMSYSWTHYAIPQGLY